MSLNDITSVDTSRPGRRRVGRGIGSGLGKTCGRGSKGEGSRSGGKNRGPLFEGGQFPFWMRLPKRGFTNFAHRSPYQAVRLMRVLERVKDKTITLETLIAAGLARPGEAIKLVGGNIEVKGKFTVTVNRVTGSVRSVIEAAGGSVTELDLQAEAAKPENVKK